MVAADFSGLTATQVLPKYRRTEWRIQKQGTASPGSLACHGAAFRPVALVEQKRIGMLNCVSIVYYEKGILFVGKGFHSKLLCGCPGIRSIRCKLIVK